MLKNRFFADTIVDLEDIWLYRIIQNRRSNCELFRQFLVKITYDIQDHFDIPLFSQIPSLSISDTRQQSKRWQKVIDNVYLYIVINPTKLCPSTGRPFSVLEQVNQLTHSINSEHYNVLINYMTSADIYNARKLSDMYRTLQQQDYQFCQRGHIDLEDQLNTIRKNFIFNFDETIEAKQKIEYEDLEAKDKKQAQTEDNSLLIFIKFVDIKQGRLIPAGHIIQDKNETLDVDKIMILGKERDAGIIKLEGRQSLILIEDTTNGCLDSDNLKKEDPVLLEDEEG
jgi:hypothetical protein